LPLFAVAGNEVLKYNYKGYWFLRINQKGRMIYRVKEEIVTVYIITAFGHYYDK